MCNTGEGALAMQRAVDVHKAGIINRRTDFGACIQDAHGLVCEHGRRHIGILDSEGSAKAAALIQSFEIDQFDPANLAQELERDLAQLQAAQRMATGMVGYPVGIAGAHVFDAELLDQELGELEHPRNYALDLIEKSAAARFKRGFPVVIANHGHAGRRRNANDFRIAKDLYEMPYQRQSLAHIPGIPVHLSAAALGRQEFNGVTQPLENAHYRFPGLREESVVIAGDKKRNAHCWTLTWTAKRFLPLMLREKPRRVSSQPSVPADESSIQLLPFNRNEVPCPAGIAARSILGA